MIPKDSVTAFLDNLCDTLNDYKAEDTLMLSLPEATYTKFMKDMKCFGASGIIPTTLNEEEVVIMHFGRFKFYIKQLNP